MDFWEWAVLLLQLTIYIFLWNIAINSNKCYKILKEENNETKKNRKTERTHNG